MSDPTSSDSTPADRRLEEIEQRLDAGGSVEARLPRWPSALLMLVGAGPTVMFVSMLRDTAALLAAPGRDADERVMLGLVLVMLVGLVAMGCGIFLLGVRLMLRSRIGWEVTRDGVVDRSRPGKPIVLGWEDILAAASVRGAVALWVREGALGRRPWHERILQRWTPSGHLLPAGNHDATTIDAIVVVIEKRIQAAAR